MPSHFCPQHSISVLSQSYHFYGVYQPVHVHCNAKNCVLIAAILSELHAPWQPVMQGYVIGLTTLNTVLFLQNHYVLGQRSKVI